jgi:hypothetical protein
MIKRYPFLFVFLLFTLNAFSQKPVILTSDKPGWHRIGELTMDEEADTAAAEIIGADAFSAVKLKALKGDVIIYEIDIYFEEGKPQCTSLEKKLKEGQQTKTILFKGGDRKVRRIALIGRKISSGDEKAEVQLNGFRPPEKKR